MVTGDAAQRAAMLESPSRNARVEAVVLSPDFKSDIVFESFTDDGYVTATDWDNLDPAALLRQFTLSGSAGEAGSGEKGLHSGGTGRRAQQPIWDFT